LYCTRLGQRPRIEEICSDGNAEENESGEKEKNINQRGSMRFPRALNKDSIPIAVSELAYDIKKNKKKRCHAKTILNT